MIPVVEKIACTVIHRQQNRYYPAIVQISAQEIKVENINGSLFWSKSTFSITEAQKNQFFIKHPTEPLLIRIDNPQLIPIAKKLKLPVTRLPRPFPYHLITMGIVGILSLPFLFNFLSQSYAQRLQKKASLATERNLMQRWLQKPISTCESQQQSQLLNRIKDHLIAEKSLAKQIKIGLIGQKNLNISSLPGGKIGITEGLVTALNRPGLLAAIIAHELAHVQLFQPIYHFVNQQPLDILLYWSQIKKQKEPFPIQLANYSYQRQEELQADYQALVMLSRAKLNPLHLGQALAAIYVKNNQAPLFKSHPLTRQRLEIIKDHKIVKKYQRKYQGKSQKILSVNDLKLLTQGCPQRNKILDQIDREIE